MLARLWPLLKVSFGVGLWIVTATKSAPGQGRGKITPVASGTGQASRSSGASVPAVTVGALLDLAGHAGVIFAGRVAAITRQDAEGFVDVRFHVDQAVRGCSTTNAYVVREWAGLWVGKAPRYRVGQRLLMLLTARGPAGMSAPVGGAGMAGAIPIITAGETPLAHGTGVAPPESGAGASDGSGGSGAVNLRWVEALAAHAPIVVSIAGPTTVRLHPGSRIHGALPFARVDESEEQAWVPSLVRADRSSEVQPSLGVVIALLKSMGGDHDDAAR